MRITLNWTDLCILYFKLHSRNPFKLYFGVYMYMSLMVVEKKKHDPQDRDIRESVFEEVQTSTIDNISTKLINPIGKRHEVGMY